MTPTKNAVQSSDVFFFLRVSVGNYERSKTSSQKNIDFWQLFLIFEAFVTSGDFVLLPFEVVVMVTWTPTSGELNANRNMPDFCIFSRLTNHATARIWKAKKVTLKTCQQLLLFQINSTAKGVCFSFKLKVRPKKSRVYNSTQPKAYTLLSLYFLMSTSPPVVPNLQECFYGFGFDGGEGKLDG